jgi:hypothetical protein
MPTNMQLISFYNRFNVQRDGNLKFPEFMKAISPLCETYEEMMKNRLPSKKVHKPRHPIMMFEPDTFNNFVRVIEHLFAEEE